MLTTDAVELIIAPVVSSVAAAAFRAASIWPTVSSGVIAPSVLRAWMVNTYTLEFGMTLIVISDNIFFIFFLESSKIVQFDARH